MYSEFWQVIIKEDHKERIVFIVPSGHYKFNRLPCGLPNSPASFQRLMDTVLRNSLRIECFTYIDDVVVYCRTAEEHTLRLGNILQKIDEANLQLHLGKCVFAQWQVQYLGFTLSANVVSASHDKVKVVGEYPTPAIVNDVRPFLGLASFYRRLERKFAEIAKPLTQLIRKGQELPGNSPSKKLLSV